MTLAGRRNWRRSAAFSKNAGGRGRSLQRNETEEIHAFEGAGGESLPEVAPATKVEQAS